MTALRVSSTALVMSLASLSLLTAQQPDSASPSARLEVHPRPPRAGRRRLAPALGPGARRLGQADPRRQHLLPARGSRRRPGRLHRHGARGRRGRRARPRDGARARVQAHPAARRPEGVAGPGQADRDRIPPGPSGARPAGAAHRGRCARPRATCGPMPSGGPAPRPAPRGWRGGGVLEARGPGKATLTAAAGGVRATTVVEVASAAPASLAIEPADAHAKQGDVVRFRVVAKDAGGKADRRA